jgi:anti-sigma regulatory factor (Ser/Thr protein kinase)
MTPPALIAVATPPLSAAPAQRAARPARSSALRLPARSWAAAVARRHVGQLLQAWRLTALTDTAQLLASELVANAVKAAQEMGASALFPAGSAAVELSVRGRQASVRIEVRDPNPERPAVRQAGPLDEGGRGLLIVAALSGSWGCYPAVGGGKVVWSEIALSGTGPAGLLALTPCTASRYRRGCAVRDGRAEDRSLLGGPRSHREAAHRSATAPGCAAGPSRTPDPGISCRRSDTAGPHSSR